MKNFFDAVCRFVLILLFIVAGDCFAGAGIYSSPMQGKAMRFSLPDLWVSVAPEISCPLFSFGKSKDDNAMYTKSASTISHEILVITQGQKKQVVELCDEPMSLHYGVSADGSPVAILKTSLEIKDKKIEIARRIFFNDAKSKLVMEVEISADSMVRCHYSFKSAWNLPCSLIADSSEFGEVEDFKHVRLGVGQLLKLEYEKSPMVAIMPEAGVSLDVANRKYAISADMNSLPISVNAERTFIMRWAMGLGDVKILRDNRLSVKKMKNKPLLKTSMPTDIDDDAKIGVGGFAGANYPMLWEACGFEFFKGDALSWANCEPVAGKIDFKIAADRISLVEKNGLGYFARITAIPDWAMLEPAMECSPIDTSKYESFLLRLTDRFAGRVMAYEIGFVPAVDDVWGDDILPSIERYSKLLAAGYKAIKRGDAKTSVISAGINGPTEAFVLELAKRGAIANCDAVGVGGYGLSPAMLRRRIRIVKNILSSSNIDKKIWITSAAWAGITDVDELVGAAGAAVGLIWSDTVNGRFALVRKPTPAGGLVFSQSYRDMIEVLQKDKKSRLKLKLPQKLKLSAGETKKVRVSMIGKSRTFDLAARLEGLDESWYSIKAVNNSLGRLAKVEFELKIPKFAKPGIYQFAIGILDRKHKLEAFTIGSLEVVNEDGYLDVDMHAMPSAYRDEDGMSNAKRGPSNDWCLLPGYMLRQPMEITNTGSEDEEFEISLEGPYASWCKLTKTSRDIPAGKKGYTLININIPSDASMGQKYVTVVVRSKRQPSLVKRSNIYFRLAKEKDKKSSAAKSE